MNSEEFNNEQRREAAEKLRAKRDEWERADTWIPQIDGYWERAYLDGIQECVPDGETLWGVLADLIERETCCDVSLSLSVFECSNCRAMVIADNDEMIRIQTSDGGITYGFDFCPYCGAEVIR